MAGLGTARADAILMLEDPINFAGRVTSAGHAALWMDTLCSDDHVTIRTCHAGETGVVLSRYESVSNKLDWLAMPPDGYLFSVDRESEIPASITVADAAKLRTDYRKAHVASFPADPGDATWASLVGESYRRRIVLVRVHTDADQDLRLMKWLNTGRNVSRFNIFYSNCGDFTGSLLNVLFPGAIHRSYLLDAGMTTPKQVGFKLHRYAVKHPEMGWNVTLLPQTQGTIPRSRRLYGVTESYLKTYPYLLPLDFLLPFELGFVTGLGLCDHRHVAHPSAMAPMQIFFSKPALAEVRGE